MSPTAHMSSAATASTAFRPEPLLPSVGSGMDVVLHVPSQWAMSGCLMSVVHPPTTQTLSGATTATPVNTISLASLNKGGGTSTQLGAAAEAVPVNRTTTADAAAVRIRDTIYPPSSMTVPSCSAIGRRRASFRTRIVDRRYPDFCELLRWSANAIRAPRSAAPVFASRLATCFSTVRRDRNRCRAISWLVNPSAT